MTSTVSLRRSRSSRGFTLLELVIAVTMLAGFILPMLQIIADSRTRAIRYTQERQVRDLAQQKLHDRIHFYETEDSGTFEAEGQPRWFWEVDPPQIRGQSDQVLLQYTIRIEVPIKLADVGSEAADGERGQGTTYEYTVWSFPDERWYEEQAILYDAGGYSPLYGSMDGSYPGYGGSY